MEPAAAGALYAVENVLEGAAALIKGLTHPTLPLKANLTNITSVPLPRAHHTISVVKGRAYIFGGEVAPGTLADNDMHIVILPSSGVLEADYTAIKPKPGRRDTDDSVASPGCPAGEVPGPRKGHTAVVIGDSIYMFGGEGVPPENGRIWVFSTISNTWSYLDPSSTTPDALFPAHRAGHAAASSDFPSPKDVTYKERAPQQPADPAKFVPEPAEDDSWGTIFLLGGRDTATGELLNDALAFDVKTRTWTNIPTPAGPPLEGASLALTGNMLYRFGGSSGSSTSTGTAEPPAMESIPPSSTPTASSAAAPIQHIDVSPVWKHADRGTTPLNSGWSWEPLTPHASPAEQEKASTATTTTTNNKAAPAARSHSGLVPVTTGQGRHYLLAIGGEPPSSRFSFFFTDIWALQLPSEKQTAALAKDGARASVKRDTNEGRWDEVVYRYVDARGDEVVGGKGRGGGEEKKEKEKEKEEEEEDGDGEKGVGARGRFAVAKGTEVDGCSVVVWGGVGGRRGGEVLGDGWLITVDR